LDTGVTSMTVDLSAVPHCDYRVLAVLDDARQRLHVGRARFTLLGLDPQALTGFARASLREVLAAYRASPGAGHPLWEPTGAPVPPGRCTDGERLLTQVCVALATSRRKEGRPGASGVGDRLTAQCVRHLSVDAAALLLATQERPGEMWVASASADRARSVAQVDADSGHGPATECLRTGEPHVVPDLEEEPDAWPRFAEAALRQGMRAVRALPLQQRWPRVQGQSSTPREGVTIGVLALFSNTAGPIAPADLGVAQAFADLAALALTTGSEDHLDAEVGTAPPSRAPAAPA
jgi:GAF domain-containing protein